jgi:hypothetical protein
MAGMDGLGFLQALMAQSGGGGQTNGIPSLPQMSPLMAAAAKKPSSSSDTLGQIGKAYEGYQQGGMDGMMKNLSAMGAGAGTGAAAGGGAAAGASGGGLGL